MPLPKSADLTPWGRASRPLSVTPRAAGGIAPSKILSSEPLGGDPPRAVGGGLPLVVDFGVQIFFDQISTFFNFDFDKKWFGGGLDPLAVEKK